MIIHVDKCISHQVVSHETSPGETKNPGIEFLRQTTIQAHARTDAQTNLLTTMLYTTDDQTRKKRRQSFSSHVPKGVTAVFTRNQYLICGRLRTITTAVVSPKLRLLPSPCILSGWKPSTHRPTYTKQQGSIAAHVTQNTTFV